MVFNPQKKVGSTASVRGIRGTYLIYMICYLVGLIFSFLIVLSLTINMYVKAGVLICAISFIIYKYFDFLKLSKGDMNKPVKDSCRIPLIIKK